MDQRRAEIEAKRARLEEMRRRRETKEREGATATWQSVTAVIARAPRPVRYTKSTQTDPADPADPVDPLTSNEDSGIIPNMHLANIETLEITPNVEPVKLASSPETTSIEPQPTEPIFTESPHYDIESVKKFLETSFKVFERTQTDLLARYDRKPAVRSAPQTIQQILELPGPLAVSAIQWSPHHPNLVACAYGTAGSILGSRGSCVLLWSLEFPTSPEYTLKAPTDISHIKFSTTSPWFVYGAGYNGQIYVWDLRQGRELLCSMRTSGDGHLLPVCALETAPGINHDLIVSLGVNGILCVWPNDRLVRPQQQITLAPPEKTAAIASTCMALWHGDQSTFLVGTIEGTIYTGRRIDSVGAKAGITDQVYTGHTAPVTCIQYHPTVDDTRVFISASLDWSVRIWKASGPLEIQLPDAATAVAWCPHSTAVFACSYRNMLEIWNLARDSQEPAARYEMPELATSIAWDPYVRTRLVCGSNKAAVLDISGDILDGAYEFV